MAALSVVALALREMGRSEGRNLGPINGGEQWRFWWRFQSRR